MSDPEKMRTRLDALWEALVLDTYPDTEATIEGRAASAVRLLEHLRSLHAEAREQGDEGKMIKCASLGHSVWSLVCIELGDWLVNAEALEIRTAAAWTGKERAPLKYQLGRAQDSLLPRFEDPIDLVPVMLPRWLSTSLLNGLQALDKGEVQSLLEPRPVGRHDDTWTQDEMRARALQYVEFLKGQGISDVRARETVALATKIASSTLRKWPMQYRITIRDLDRRLSLARLAGEIKETLDRDPSDRSPVEAHAYALFEELKSQPLAEFGRSYQSRFGGRPTSIP